MLDYFRRSTDRIDVVPSNPEQATTLSRADAVLEHPRIKAILSERDKQLRDSFARADRRLAGR